MSDYPTIVYRWPHLSSGPVVSTTESIIFRWSQPIDSTQFSDNTLRATHVVVFEKNNGTQIPISFTSYTDSRNEVSLTPTSPYESGKTYVVIVNRGVRDTFGRGSAQDFRWEFTTALSSLSDTSLLSPADLSIVNVFPTLSWAANSATGSINYQLQLSSLFDYSSVDYGNLIHATVPASGTTTPISITPAGSFTAESTYYWRVRCYTNSASGDWSDPASFYFGTSRIAHSSSSESWNDPLPLQVSACSFVNGLSNLQAWPTIKLVFTRVLPNLSDITLVAKILIPRNDVPASFNDTVVSGSWSSGAASSFTFTPTVAIANNTRYELVLPATLTASDGTLLGVQSVYFFTGPYSPYYVPLRSIRARFLGAESKIPDDLINYYIYQASLEVKAKYYASSLGAGFGMGDSLKESYVRDTANLVSYGALKWVEAAATYNLLKSILRRELQNIGRTRQQGDYTEKLDSDYLKALQAAKQDAAEELATYGDYVSPSDLPMTGSTGSAWPGYAWNYDAMVGRDAFYRPGF